MKKIYAVLLLLFISFSQNSLALDAPVLRHSLSGTQVAASWSAVPGATSYILNYAPYPFTGVESIGSIDMGSNLSLEAPLFEGAHFYIAVQAINDREASEYSNIDLFRLPAFNTEMLSGQTFYDVFTNDNNDGFRGYPLTFNADGSLTQSTRAVTDLSTVTLTSGSWSLDDKGVLAVTADGSTSYFKLLNTTNQNAYQVCWRSSYDEAAACSASSEYLFFDMSTAQNYMDTMSPIFSMDWLNGKTLYAAHFGSASDEQGNHVYNVPSVTRYVFDNGEETVTNIMNSDLIVFTGLNQASRSYQVTDEGWHLNDNPLCVGPFFLKTQYVDGEDTAEGATIWFFDEAEAINYANSLTSDIPLECN